MHTSLLAGVSDVLLCTVAYQRNHLEAAAAWLERGVARLSATWEWPVYLAALFTLAATRQAQGDPAAARHTLSHGERWAAQMLSEARDAVQGQLVEGALYLAAAGGDLETLRRTLGERPERLRPRARVRAALALAEAGEESALTDELLAWLSESVARADALGITHELIALLAYQALAHLLRGDTERARKGGARADARRSRGLYPSVRRPGPPHGRAAGRDQRAGRHGRLPRGAHQGVPRGPERVWA